MSTRRRPTTLLFWVFATPIFACITSLALFIILGNGCDDGHDPIGCGPDGCSDAGGDGDGDGDGDSDSDADSDGDVDADADMAPGDECASAADCVLAMNFNVCCTCPMALPRANVEQDPCIFEAATSPERPEGCGEPCFPDLCSPCEAEPTGVGCFNGRCRNLYPGSCTPGEAGDCPENQICDLVDGEAQCVDDPNECRRDADCTVNGYECRDWRSEGIRWCWHPDSTCFDDLTCRAFHFCEDVGSGVFRCVDHAPDCRPEYSGQDEECDEDEVCEDPDGDGHGSCVPR